MRELLERVTMQCPHRMGVDLPEEFKLNTICIRIVEEMYLCLHSNNRSPLELFNKEPMFDFKEYY
jgi:hypothetical protein